MNLELINHYYNLVISVRRAPIQGGGKYPHKIIFVISLIQLIDDGIIVRNEFPASKTFKSIFENLWKIYASNLPAGDFNMPWTHLETDGIWMVRDGIGKLDQNFFEFLKDRNNRRSLKNSLIIFLELEGTYVSQAEEIISYESDPLLNRIAKKVLRNEPSEPNEIYLRSTIFKIEVKKKYNFRCCISNSLSKFQDKIFLLEACHIKKFAISGNDSIDNGIALNPLFHDAYDEGLFTIDSNYQVVVSEKFENDSGPFNLKQFHGSKIKLPKKKEYYPSQEFLKWHRENQFERFV